MLHLLPQYQKRKVIKEYRLRLGIVIIAALFYTVIIFGVFTLPSFIKLNNEKIILNSKKVTLEGTINSSNNKDGGHVTNSAQAIIALAPYNTSLAPILFIDAVLPDTAGISISGYSFNQAGPTDPVNVVISGIAKTREDLSGYAQLLNSRFGNVKLPLSSLANSSNINFDFRFSMTYAQAKAIKDTKDQ